MNANDVNALFADLGDYLEDLYYTQHRLEDSTEAWHQGYVAAIREHIAALEYIGSRTYQRRVLSQPTITVELPYSDRPN